MTKNSKSILLIGPNQDVKQVLKKENYQVITVVDTKEALKIDSENFPDVVLLNSDAASPEMNFIDEIKKRSPATLILLITGENDVELVNNSLIFSRVFILQNPISGDQVFRTIKELERKTEKEKSIEKRKFARVRTQLPAKLVSDGDSLITDLSTGGLFIETDKELGLGEFVEIQFKTNTGVISLEAEVRWCRKGNRDNMTSSGFGLRFRSLSATDQKNIRKFILDIFKERLDRFFP